MLSACYPGCLDEDYVFSLYESYLLDTSSVDPSWWPLFDQMKSWGEVGSDKIDSLTFITRVAEVEVSARIAGLIDAYRRLGHLHASIDPLGLEATVSVCKELSYSEHGFSEKDLDSNFFVGGFAGAQFLKLSEVIDLCKKFYSQDIGFELGHLDVDRLRWCVERIENRDAFFTITDDHKKLLLSSLMRAEGFESFLDKKFQGAKRFSVEGCDVLLPLLESIVMGRGGVPPFQSVVIGMAHRGRLNVLVNVLHKPYVCVFKEFGGETLTGVSGDVKYHMGCRYRSEVGTEVVLLPNPSHLESVNTVVGGYARAWSDRDNIDTGKILPILIHGDAALSGQGIVLETFLLSALDGYQTAGTLHIVTNNQIGFTTHYQCSRSTTYCSDTIKMLSVPVFHVNADSVESAFFVLMLALEYRQKFGTDVLIDLCGYRRYGHNEGDDPFLTQPVMYTVIKDHPRVYGIYKNRLLAEGVVTDAVCLAEEQKFFDLLEQNMLEKDSPLKVFPKDVQDADWKHYATMPKNATIDTGMMEDVLGILAERLMFLPQDFKVHPRLLKQLEKRFHPLMPSGSGHELLDWGAAEALAFAGIIYDGFHIRLSGEDSQRGTFSHRHAVLSDVNSGKEYTPLHHISSAQGSFKVVNSPLSEFGVLGFEYGYSLKDPRTLVLWEAQFGDFVNGAQVIIDQFIAAGEDKWGQQSALTLLLPHGYEGQGPEHSHAYLERYLGLCADNNMRVCVITTPANYFHVLRRQLLSESRKPLVIMTPKSLLRHRLCVSPLSDLYEGRSFAPVIIDSVQSSVRRVVLCSGKVYYDLLEKKEADHIQDVVLVRLEQLYPFPSDELAEITRCYASAEWVWCQEETRNRGAYFFVNDLFDSHFGIRLRFVGRPATPSPAVGSFVRHGEEQKKLLSEALV